jgi:hypothetical protein
MRTFSQSRECLLALSNIMRISRKHTNAATAMRPGWATRLFRSVRCESLRHRETAERAELQLHSQHGFTERGIAMAILTAADMKVANLFNYQPFCVDWLRQIMFDRKIHFSDPNNFNDPFDCQLSFDKLALDDGNIYEQHVAWFDRVSREGKRFSNRNRTPKKACSTTI